MEGQFDIRFKELQLRLIKEVRKNIAETILTGVKEIIQNEVKECCM